MYCFISIRSRNAESCHVVNIYPILFRFLLRMMGVLTNAVMRLLVHSIITLGWCLRRSTAVSREFTALIASNGSLPFKVCSLLAVMVSISSMKTQTRVSGSSSSIDSMLLNIFATSFPLSLKNLLPRECALISTNLLRGNCRPSRIANFWANPRLE